MPPVGKHEPIIMEGRGTAVPCSDRKVSRSMDSTSDDRVCSLAELRFRRAPRNGKGSSSSDTSSVLEEDASTLTRTDSETTTSDRSSSPSSIGSAQLMLGWGESSSSSSPQPPPVPTTQPSSFLFDDWQVQFAERTAAEMAEIVNYWKAYADAAALGRAAPPPPEACFPGNSLLEASDDEASFVVHNNDDDDDERDCGSDDEGEGGEADERCRQEEIHSRRIGDTGVSSTTLDGHLRHLAQRPCAAGLRRRSHAMHTFGSRRCRDNVYDPQHPRPPSLDAADSTNGLAHGQRWAVQAIMFLWLLAVVVRWPECCQELVRFVTQVLLQLLIQIARGYLELLVAARNAVEGDEH